MKQPFTEEDGHRVMFTWSIGSEKFGANVRMSSGQVKKLEIGMPLERFNELCPSQQRQMLKVEMTERLLSGSYEQ